MANKQGQLLWACMAAAQSVYTDLQVIILV